MLHHTHTHRIALCTISLRKHGEQSKCSKPPTQCAGLSSSLSLHLLHWLGVLCVFPIYADEPDAVCARSLSHLACSNSALCCCLMLFDAGFPPACMFAVIRLGQSANSDRVLGLARWAISRSDCAAFIFARVRIHLSQLRLSMHA
jgi:hypothetical protein